MMTPMLRALHEAHKARLPRLGVPHIKNIVPFSRIYRTPPPEPKLTPFNEIEKPVIEDKVKICQIQQVVAQRYRITLAEMISGSRLGLIMLPRQIAFTLVKRLTDKSLPAIGREFGDRDHTTILHGIQKMEERASKDPEFAAELAQLEYVIMG